jgi:hypothetical protein
MAALIIFCFLISCSSNKPDDKLLKIHVEKELNLPFKYEISGLKVDWVKAGEKRLEGIFTLKIETTSPIYEKADLKDAIEKAGLKSSELGLLNHALSEAEKLPEPYKSEMLEKAPSNRVDSPQYVRVAMDSGFALTGSGNVTAVMESDGWRFDFAPNWHSKLFTEIRNKISSPYYELRPGLMSIDDRETSAFLKKAIEETNQYAKLIDSAAKQVAMEREEAAREAEKDRLEAANKNEIRRQEVRTDILNMLHPGAIFIFSEHSLSRVTELPRITELGYLSVVTNEKSGRITGYLHNPKIPDKQIHFTIHTEIDERFTALLRLSAENTTVDFRRRDDGFEEKETRNGGAHYVLAPTSQAEFERAMGQGRQRLMAEKKKRNDYQTNLGRAFAAGSAFQGTVIRSSGQSGALGLFIENRSDDGLGCTGYLFDPADRSLRKPFQGFINKEYAASNALTIATQKGTGIKDDSKRFSDFQRLYLSVPADYTLSMKLNGAALEGKAIGEAIAILNPINNFAELLAKDEADEQKRQDNITNAVASGKAWIGTFACSSGSFVGELGLYFASLDGSSSKGYIFDPNDMGKRKNFNGSISLDKYAGWAIQLDLPKGSGVNRYDGMPKSQDYWLRTDDEYKLFFNTHENEMRGASQSECTLQLKPVADYSAMLKQYDKAINDKMAKVESAIEPLTIYRGIWKATDAQGEIEIKIDSRSTVTFSASAYDPKTPELVWNFAGTMINKPNGVVTFRLIPTGKDPPNIPELHRLSTSYILRNRSREFILQVTEDGLEGMWSDIPVTLKRIYLPN